MMENYDRILELQEAGLNSSGELFEANQVRVESLDGQIGQLKVSLEELYGTIITEDGMSFLIKSADGAVQGITVVTKVLKVALIPTVVTATAALVAYQVALASTGKSTLVNSIINNTLSMVAGLEKLIVTIKASKAAMLTFGAITGGALIGGAVIATFTALNAKIAETRAQIEGVTDVAENLDTSLEEIDATDKLVDQYKSANKELSTKLVGTDDYIAKQQEINGLKEQLMQYSPEFKTLLENETLELDKQYNIMKNMLDLKSRESVQEAVDALPGSGTGVEDKRVRDITGNMANTEQLLQDFIVAKKNYEKLLAESANTPAEQMSEIAANLEKARADMETSEKTFMSAMSPLSDSMAWVDNYNDVLEKGIKTFADLDGRNPITLPDGTTEKYQDIVNMYYEIKGLSEATTEEAKEQASILESIKNMEPGKTFSIGDFSSEGLDQLIDELRDVEKDGKEAEAILGQLQSVFEDMPDDIDTLSDAVEYLNSKFRETAEAADMKELNESYLEALEGLEEAQKLLDSFSEGLDASEMRSLFDSDLMADFNGSLNDTAGMIDHIKDKMQELQDKAYEAGINMALNNSDTWNQMTEDMAESLGIQASEFQNYLNEKGLMREVDIQNANSAAEAQTQAEMSVVRQGAQAYVDLINSKAGNRQDDMGNVAAFLNEQKTKEATTVDELKQMWAAYYNARKQMINSEISKARKSIDAMAGPYDDQGNIDPATMSQFNTLRKQLNALESANTTMVNYFENVSTGLTTVSNTLNQAVTSVGNSIGKATSGSDSKKGSSSKKNSSTTKEVADLELKIDRYYQLQDAIDDVNNALEENKRQQERAEGKQQLSKLYEERLKLLEKQKKAYENLRKEQLNEAQEFRNAISNAGFKMDGDGNITNYQTQLKKMVDYANSLSGDAKSAQIEYVNSIVDIIDAYTTLTNKTIPNTEESIDDVAQSIKNLNKEHEEALKYLNDLKDAYYNLDKAVKEINNALDINREKQENATPEERIKLMEEEIALMKERQDIIQEQEEAYKKSAQDIAKQLSSQGIKFDSNGKITNYDEVVDNLINIANGLVGTSQEEAKEKLEDLLDLIKEYDDIMLDTLPNLSKEWVEYANAIKEAEKTKAELVTDVQKNITSAIENEYNKRYNALKSALQKEKDLLNKEYEEEDHQNTLAKKNQELAEIQKAIDDLSRDTSDAGQMKLQELLQQYKDKQEEINEYIRDYEKQQGNNRFDEEMEKLDEELDEILSPENLANMVNQALVDGFVTIGDEVIELNTLMSDWLNETGDGLYAVGDILREELINNLQTAQGLFADMGILTTAPNSQGVNAASQVLDTLKNITELEGGQKHMENNISIDSLLRVEGNITEDVLPKIENMIDEFKNDFEDVIIEKLATEMAKY